MAHLNDLGPGLNGLEQLHAMLAGDIRPGIARVLGIRLVEAEDGRVVLEATPDESHYNIIGTVHGGYAATMLDFACGYAIMTRNAPGQTCPTLELKVAYHRAMTRDSGLVRAEGRLVSHGRRAAFSEARLTDCNGKLLASATSSLIILSP